VKTRWKNVSSLGKGAAILAAMGILSLGLCGLSFADPHKPGPEFYISPAAFLGMIGLLISLLGLLVVGVLGVFKMLGEAAEGPLGRLREKLDKREKPLGLFDPMDTYSSRIKTAEESDKK
jgi:hypothetical protein